MPGRIGEAAPAFDVRSRAKIVAVVAFSAVMGLLVTFHIDWVYGPPYWKWGMRSIASPWLIPLFLASAIPTAAGIIIYKKRGSVRSALSCTMLSMFLMMMAAVWLHPSGIGFERISHLVASPITTSYHYDMRYYQFYDSFSDWMEAYPGMMKSLHVHSVNKGPGPILYYVGLYRLFQKDSALVGGVLIGLLACLVVPCVFYLLTTLGLDKEAALGGAIFYSLAPAPLLIYPQFDQVYPILSSLLLVFWIQSLEAQKLRFSIAFGLALSLILFTSFALLTLGLFLLGYSLYFLQREEFSKDAATLLLRQSVIALATVSTLYLVLYLMFDFDILRTFASAVENNLGQGMDATRPYSQAVYYVVYDFFLGAGWIAACLLVLLILDGSSLSDKERWILLACLMQIGGAAISGTVRAETARVWIYMIPILMYPVALQLRRLGRRGCLAVLGCQFSLTVVVFKNMGFL